MAGIRRFNTMQSSYMRVGQFCSRIWDFKGIKTWVRKHLLSISVNW